LKIKQILILLIFAFEKPEILKLNGSWQAAIKKSLQKKRPASGWPRTES